ASTKPDRSVDRTIYGDVCDATRCALGRQSQGAELRHFRQTKVAIARRAVAGPDRRLPTVPRMVPGTGIRRRLGMYELMGRAHAALVRERGQGTAEYLGPIL